MGTHLEVEWAEGESGRVMPPLSSCVCGERNSTAPHCLVSYDAEMGAWSQKKHCESQVRRVYPGGGWTSRQTVLHRTWEVWLPFHDSKPTTSKRLLSPNLRGYWRIQNHLIFCSHLFLLIRGLGFACHEWRNWEISVLSNGYIS